MKDHSMVRKYGFCEKRAHMKSVMLSLKPQWCRKILSGEKTVEIRKTIPRCQCPFKVYLYETKLGCGAVVGECLCYCVGKLDYLYDMTAASCLSPWQVQQYACGKNIYGWFLSSVVQYDNPRPITDFGFHRAPQSWCYAKKQPPKSAAVRGESL
jgi:predicted transcriptional regulator